jgi:hypothetical protein
MVADRRSFRRQRDRHPVQVDVAVRPPAFASGAWRVAPVSRFRAQKRGIDEPPGAVRESDLEPVRAGSGTSDAHPLASRETAYAPGVRGRRRTDI